MAKLINGNGNPAVYANEDSDWFAAIMGNQTSITAIGEQFRADQADANTIEVFDGVIITKEGRRIQLDANQVDLFEIPTGTQGQTNYYIIGYHLYTDTDSNQFCEVFVQLMESASDTIPEDTFRGGADEVFVSLYRVTQVGLNITDIDLLLPTIKNILQINADLSELIGKVGNGMKCALYGHTSIGTNATVTIDISSLNLTDPSEYMVIIDTGVTGRNGSYGNWGDGVYIDEKNADNFKVKSQGSADRGNQEFSYQIITFK